MSRLQSEQDKFRLYKNTQRAIYFAEEYIFGTR